MNHDPHPQTGSVRAALPRENPRLLTLVRALFYLNALIWLLIGVFSFQRTAGSTSMLRSLLWVLLGLMLGNALVMLVTGWKLAGLDKRFYYLGIAVLAVNILLTITDEFGWIDLATLLFDLILLVLLFATRSRYRKNESRASSP